MHHFTILNDKVFNLNVLNVRKIIILSCVSLLVACSGESVIKPEAKTPASRQSSTAQQPDTKNAAKPGTGGYYLDDGPGDNAPADIDNIPDATLKTEAPLVRANKPYSALGQKYTPMTKFSPYKKQGIASWYGKRFHGKKTSNGEVYDMYAMSGAHTTLPLPSYVKVINPANGRSVIVRLNDRGPFKHNRLIDLSYAAAHKLRLISQGSGLVEVEAIDTSAEAMLKLPKNAPAKAGDIASSASSKNSTGVMQDEVSESVAIQTVPIIKSNNEVALTPSSPTNNVANMVNTTHYVQAGAFKSGVNGELLQKKIQSLTLAENVGVANVYNNGLYRVKLGPYASRTEADASAANIRKQLNTAAIVTNQ